MKPWQPPAEFEGYRLVRLLGRGGMGQVHLAHDAFLDRLVAIKFISSAEPDLEARRRFLVEARAIARLQHPNVVSVYRVGEVDGFPYLVSEYVEGISLDQLPRPITSDRAIEIGLQMARALAAAHRRGVLHRDIKPANAVVSVDGEVKLLDFGIAKLLDPTRERGDISPPPASSSPALLSDVDSDDMQTAEVGTSGCGAFASDGPVTCRGVVVGTPAYMAPEVRLGEAASFRSDVFSLGALLYFLCTGITPYPPRALRSRELAAQLKDPRPVLELASEIDPKLASVIDECVRRDPLRRFDSGSELRTALAQIAPDAGARPLPEGNPYRGLRAFEAEHAALYFGRDSEIRGVLELLRDNGLTVVAGPSGVGKSSLCRAGVLPRIRASFGSEREWSHVAFMPGHRPAHALAGALAPALGVEESVVEALVRDDPAGLSRALRAKLGQHRGMVVFVDQLEELITLGEEDQVACVAEALGWLCAIPSCIRVLGTVRGDFLSQLSSLPRIGNLLPRVLYFLRPLSRERLREAIVGPAKAKGVDFESSAMVEELVDAASHSDGGLPLLQFTLAELWDTREPGATTIALHALRAMGGLNGALSRHADQVLASLAAPQRLIARCLLRGLVSAENTRTRRTPAELGAADATTRRVLDALVSGRLIVARDTPDGATYEIAHEAMLHAWDTLARWLAKDIDQRLIQDRLGRAAVEWDRIGRPREALWGPRQLEEVRELQLATLPALHQTFIARSRALQRRRMMMRVSVATGLVVAVGTSYGLAAYSQSKALEERAWGHVNQGEALISDAKERVQQASEAKARASTLFDDNRLEQAEHAWTQAQARGDAIGETLSRAGQELETALLLSPNRLDVRSRLADLLLERARFADEQRRHQERDELLGRMRLYDDGTRSETWARPSTVTVRTSIAGVHLELLRNDPIAQTFVPIPTPEGAHWSLEPDSYMARVWGDDGTEVRVPFVVQRERDTNLQILIPRGKDVPKGFVYIPEGDFFFGSASDEGLRKGFFKSVPLHLVRQEAFLMSRIETTFADWIVFLDDLSPEDGELRRPRVTTGGFQGALELYREAKQWVLRLRPTQHTFELRNDEQFEYPLRTNSRVHRWRQLPVTGISAADAEAYVGWLAKTNRVPGARLCTEREWERAARGADARNYPHGDRLEPGDANHDETYGKQPLAMGPDEVGTHPRSRSPFGVDDMAGNVWEWTRASIGNGYVARGGAYYFDTNAARIENREIPEPSFRDSTVGMRVCADLDPGARRSP